jgi:hypothetical protein
VRNPALWLGMAGLALVGGAHDALAAKPTDAFKKAVESVWRKVPYSRMTGKSGTVQTWAVVLTEGVVTGAPMIRLQSGMTYDDSCYVMERAEGAFHVPDPGKQDLKKLHEPVKPGTVMKLWDVSFKDEGVVFYLSDPGRDVTRSAVKGGFAKTEWETFCVLLRFSMAPSGTDRLDAVDAAKMLSTIEGVIKPFSSDAAAREFAGTIKTP